MYTLSIRPLKSKLYIIYVYCNMFRPIFMAIIWQFINYTATSPRKSLCAIILLPSSEV